MVFIHVSDSLDLSEGLGCIYVYPQSKEACNENDSTF